MATTTELLDRAAGHLHAAAQHADQLGEQQDLPVLLAFAGQIRLTAAGLSRDPGPYDGQAGASLAEQLQSALDTLDEIPPLDGPPDLPMWASHVVDLIRVAKDIDAR
jgi:hypothetical protein